MSQPVRERKSRSSVVSVLLAVAMALLLVLVFQQLIQIQSRLEALEVLVANVLPHPQSSPSPPASPGSIPLGSSFDVTDDQGRVIGRITPGDVTMPGNLIGVFVHFDGIGDGFAADPNDWSLSIGVAPAVLMVEPGCPDNAPKSCLIGRPLNGARSTEGWLWFQVADAYGPAMLVYRGDNASFQVPLGDAAVPPVTEPPGVRDTQSPAPPSTEASPSPVGSPEETFSISA